jgi:hypothetical protein
LSEKKLDTRVMGPGLAPAPPVKMVSMDGRGGSVIVGRAGAGAGAEILP